MRPDIGDGLLARIHGFDEVGRVVRADFAAVNLFDGSFRQRIAFEFLDRLPNDLASVDKEPTFCAFKEDAVVTFAGDYHFYVVGHIDFNFKIGGGVVLIVNHRVPILVIHRQRVFDRRHFARPRVAGSESPAGNVNVMRAPVGQFSTGIFVPVSEGVVAITVKRYATTVTFFAFRGERGNPLSELDLANVPSRVLREQGQPE